MFYWIVDMLELPSQFNTAEEVASVAAIVVLVFMITSIADLVYMFFKSFWH